jgi:hypothetical protein
MQLWDYPQIKVRLSCACGYRLAYKLITLGDVYGARAELDDVLHALKNTKCPKWHDGTARTLRCKLQFTDLKSVDGAKT